MKNSGGIWNNSPTFKKGKVKEKKWDPKFSAKMPPLCGNLINNKQGTPKVKSPKSKVICLSP